MNASWKQARKEAGQRQQKSGESWAIREDLGSLGLAILVQCDNRLNPDACARGRTRMAEGEKEEKGDDKRALTEHLLPLIPQLEPRRDAVIRYIDAFHAGKPSRIGGG